MYPKFSLEPLRKHKFLLFVFLLGDRSFGIGWRQVHRNSSSSLERGPLLTETADRRVAQTQRIDAARGGGGGLEYQTKYKTNIWNFLSLAVWQNCFWETHLVS